MRRLDADGRCGGCGRGLWHRVIAGLLALPVLWLASGCSLLPGAKPRDADEAAAVPTRPALRLRVDAPAPLAALLGKHLDLARLQELPVDVQLSALELARLVAGAPAQARELLQTEGYFEARVTVERVAEVADGLASSGAEAGAVPPSAAAAGGAAGAAAQPIPVLRVRVEPGPRVQVHSLQVRSVGALSQRAEQGDADARALRDGLGLGLPLQPGRPFRNPDWSDTKQQVANRLRTAGYAAPQIVSSRADIELPERAARLTIEADSGPLFRAGEIRVTGLKHHDADTVRQLAGFGDGAALTETLLLDYQDRLRKAGLFQSISVAYDPDPAQADAATVKVQLTEQALQQATVGLGYSDNSGPRATLEHTHRRPFGWAVSAYNKLEWGRDRQGWTGDFQTHPRAGFTRDLLGAQIERVIGDADVVLSQRLRLGRSQDTPRFERLAFVELLRSRQSVLGTPGLAPITASAATANLHVLWRVVDHALLPTDGFTLALQAAAGQASSSAAPDGPVARLFARWTAFRPFRGPWYGQLRVEAGQLFYRDGVAVPDAMGFRAGGDDSVRGYAYRALAPVAADGRTISGRKLFTASAELARPVSARLPSVWGAGFIDIGRAADQWHTLKPALGYGLGIRVRSPVGPLRLDVARGHELRRWRLHLSVGVTL